MNWVRCVRLKKIQKEINIHQNDLCKWPYINMWIYLFVQKSSKKYVFFHDARVFRGRLFVRWYWNATEQWRMREQIDDRNIQTIFILIRDFRSGESLVILVVWDSIIGNRYCILYCVIHIQRLYWNWIMNYLIFP